MSCKVTRYQHLFRTTLTPVQFTSKYDFGPKKVSGKKVRSCLCCSSGRESVKFTELKSTSDHQLEPLQDSVTNCSLLTVGISNPLKFTQIHFPLYC